MTQTAGGGPAQDQAGGGASPPEAMIVPVFPLPNLFLIPGSVLPLHVFEARYRQMIEDILDGPGRIVIAALEERWQGSLEGWPPLPAIGGLGEIGRHERLPDGRFLIWLVGLARVAVREVASDRLYRKVAARPLGERPPDPAREPALRRRLAKALRSRSRDPGALPADLPLGRLADLLLLHLRLPQPRMLELYSRLEVADRAERALAEHDRLPLQTSSDETGTDP